MSKDLETGLEVDQGITEESFKETLERHRELSFKKEVAQYQVQYLRYNLRKPKEVSVQACASMLQEINGYLKHFLGPDLNSTLAGGEIISILVAMAPTVWCMKMVSINLDSLTKTLMEVIE